MAADDMSFKAERIGPVLDVLERQTQLATVSFWCVFGASHSDLTDDHLHVQWGF